MLIAVFHGITTRYEWNGDGIFHGNIDRNYWDISSIGYLIIFNHILLMIDEILNMGCFLIMGCPSKYD